MPVCHGEPPVGIAGAGMCSDHSRAMRSKILTRRHTALRWVGIAMTLLLPALLPACGGGGDASSDAAASPPSAPQLALAVFVSGFTAPIGFEVPDDSSNRMFVVEQTGRIRVIRNGSLLPNAFLDVSALIESGGEKGLLGLAFHPGYAGNRRFFVNYTRRVAGQLQSVIAEYLASIADPDEADLASERQLLVVDQPFDNHNGGQLAFGSDGNLYIGTGDGGSGGDPFGNGQNTSVLLGKILRIGVDAPFAPGLQYAIPPDNPFVMGGGRAEIWAYGLRNPWRFSFDRASGALFAADVGQDDREEINIIVRGGNYGWNIMEGSLCFPPPTPTCASAGLVAPISEYSHDAGGGIATIGGYVYNGPSIPDLRGAYVFGDLQSGRVWTLKLDTAGAWQRTLVLTHSLTVSSFGQDAAGEIYLLDYGNGSVLRVLAAP